MSLLKLSLSCAWIVVLMVLTAHAQERRRGARLPEGVRMEADVEFGRVGDHALLLDLYRPAETGEAPLPAVVWIHGGGWRAGDKNNAANAAALAQHGYLAASINYRLSGTAPFPAAVEDCKLAVRWLRSQAARLRIDPERIGVWGSSAGGHLALMVGCADAAAGLEGKGLDDVSSRVQAVCSWFGPADFTPKTERVGRGGNPVALFLGGEPEEIPELYVLASPVTHASKDDPPVLLVHGDRDPVVPLGQSETMLAALQKAGVESSLVVVKNAGHGFKPTGGEIAPSDGEIRTRCVEFFDRWLKPEREE